MSEGEGKAYLVVVDVVYATGISHESLNHVLVFFAVYIFAVYRAPNKVRIIINTRYPFERDVKVNDGPLGQVRS